MKLFLPLVALVAVFGVENAQADSLRSKLGRGLRKLTGTQPNSTCVPPPSDVIEETEIELVNTIMEIQGDELTSPFVNNLVYRVKGVVTAVTPFIFYFQDPEGDGDQSTSDGIGVSTGKVPDDLEPVPLTGVFEGAVVPLEVGDLIVLKKALVREFVYMGPAFAYLHQPFSNLLTSEDSIVILTRGNALPKPVTIGQNGRLPPTEDMAAGVDFWESLKGMLVTVKTPLAVTPSFINYVYTVTDHGEFASGFSERGTLNVSPNDFNPENVLLVESGGLGFSTNLPNSNVGAKFDDVLGIVTQFTSGEYGINAVEHFGLLQPSGLEKTTATCKKDPFTMSVVTYNIQGWSDYEDLAKDIVENMGVPDVLALQYATEVDLATLVAAIDNVIDEAPNTYKAVAEDGSFLNILYNPWRISQYNDTISFVRTTPDAPEQRRLEAPKDLGNDRDLIVNGEDAAEDEFPFFAAAEGVGCGASLIHGDILLTAAHCVAMTRGDGGFEGNANQKVYVGVHTVDPADPFSGYGPADAETAYIESVIIHERYVGGSISPYDFAILKLDRIIENTQPIAMNEDPAVPAIGDVLTVIGIGVLDESSSSSFPDTLQKIDVTYFGDRECNEEFGLFRELDPKVEFCTKGYMDGMGESCQGDSGGPIFQEIDGKPVQVGIVSWGKGCTDGGVYSRVSGAIDWIHEQICRNTDVRPLPDYCDPMSTGAYLAAKLKFLPLQEKFDVINVKFADKIPSAARMGVNQPFEDLQEACWIPDAFGPPNFCINGGVDYRLAESNVVRAFIDGTLENSQYKVDDPKKLIVLGNMNDNEWVSPIVNLKGTPLKNLVDDIPHDERYSYVSLITGNSEAKDYIFVSEDFCPGTKGEYVHINSEFYDGLLHDPMLACIHIPYDDDSSSYGGN